MVQTKDRASVGEQEEVLYLRGEAHANQVSAWLRQQREWHILAKDVRSGRYVIHMRNVSRSLRATIRSQFF